MASGEAMRGQGGDTPSCIKQFEQLNVVLSALIWKQKGKVFSYTIDMADLNARFEEAQATVKSLPPSVGNDDLLKVYGLYKQATVGDCNTDRPGMFDMKGKAKWDAWNALKGVSQDKAKEDYVALANELKEKYQ